MRCYDLRTIVLLIGKFIANSVVYLRLIVSAVESVLVQGQDLEEIIWK